MNLDRLLAIVGILIGVPGFVLLFLSDKWAHGVFVLCIVLALAGWYIQQRVRDSMPVFTVLELTKRLVVRDPAGTKATFSRTQKVRVNHKGITEWWCRNLIADGPMSNIMIDGAPPDEVVSGNGTLAVCRRFPPKQRGEIWESTITYDLDNAFTKRREQLIHYTAFSTKRLTMIVELSSPSHHQEAQFTFGGEQMEIIPALQASNNGQFLKLEMKKPRMGGQYHLVWEN